jgi:hypothetical protein
MKGWQNKKMQPRCGCASPTGCKGKNPLQSIKEDCMTHLGVLLFGSEEVFGSFGLWAFHKSETIRRVAEASSDSAKTTVELLREQHRMALQKTREGMKIAGVINIGVGIGLLIFLRALIGAEPVYLCGLIPGFIGVGMLVYVYVLAEPLV